MITIPKKVLDRLSTSIKQYQAILTSAKTRDINEADTVTIVKDMLADIFGYDKYSEVTSEHCIRGTFCDLATRIDGTIGTLIEVKAIGLELKDHHIKQVVDYAANQGSEWVLLTNGVCWRVYHVEFSKPIDHELVVDLDFVKLNPKSSTDLEMAFLWCREGWIKSALGEYHSQQQALSRYFLGALLVSDPVLDVLRRELRRLSPDVRIETELIKKVLESEVIKRDVLEGDKAEEGRKRVARAARKALRSSIPKEDGNAPPAEPVAVPDTVPEVQ